MLCPAVAVLGTSDLRTARMLAWLRRDLNGSCSMSVEQVLAP